MADPPAFVDTNVFVYALDADEPVKREQALQLLASPPAGGLVTSTQVLGELFVAATRQLQLSVERARTELERIAPLARVAVDRKLVLAAIDLLGDASISYWDALIVRAAATLGCDRLLTEDLNAGQRIGGVLVVNPFEADSYAP